MQRDPTGDADPKDASRVAGVALNVSSLEASRVFYTDVLGMTHATTLQVPGQGSEWVMTMSGRSSPDETPIVLADLGEGPEPGSESFGRVVIYTSEADAIADRARAGGYAVTKYPMPAGIDMVVYFVIDPDGYRVEVVQGTPPGKTQ